MTFGVRWLLRRMDICPNAYYNYRKDRKAGYRERKEQLKDKILKIFHEYSGNPGYRMMRVYLLRAKISLSHATILKYMQELGIQSTVKPKKPAYKKGDCYKKFENHLNREFHAEKPNEKWCTDFTYIFMEDGRKRYNCSIIDLYDRSVVATLNSSHIDAELAIQTLKTALEKNHHPKGLLLHSDQGSQYTSRAFTDYCKEAEVLQSMSTAGCPYDNSPMESFYGTFKAEFIRKHRFSTDEELNKATMEYAYVYYNHTRPHSSNGYKTPFEKRTQV